MSDISFHKKGFWFYKFLPFIRKGFSNKFLEECLIYFKICGDGKKYIYIVRYGVCNMYGNYL